MFETPLLTTIEITIDKGLIEPTQPLILLTTKTSEKGVWHRGAGFLAIGERSTIACKLAFVTAKDIAYNRPSSWPLG